MAFVYPVFQSLFQYISRRNIYQKWGEAHSDHIKEHHQLGFSIIEVSGAPWANNQEHFMGDK
jgi:hypothetical protein